MPHDHDHRPPADLGPAFRWAVGLNTAYVVVEGGGGLDHRIAGFAGGCRPQPDRCCGAADRLGGRRAGQEGSDRAAHLGLGRATILAALFNAIAILVGVGAVTWEAVQRLSDPVAVPGLTVTLVALVGIAVNTGSALLFMSSRKGDLNAKGAFLHMAADAAVSGAVVLAAAGIMVTGWDWLDPAVAIAVSLLIAITAAGLFREALHLSLDGVPFQIDRAAIADWLVQQDGVQGLHDLHIWPLSTTRTALAVHLVWQGPDPDAFIDRVTDALAETHGIANVTLQLEGRPCDRAA